MLKRTVSGLNVFNKSKSSPDDKVEQHKRTVDNKLKEIFKKYPKISSEPGTASEVIADLNKQIEDNTINTTFRYIRAEVLNKSGDTSGAINDYKFIIKESPYAWMRERVEKSMAELEKQEFSYKA